MGTLLAALKAADLVETLSGEGPYTVFAPFDVAFEALPAGLLDCLLLPDNKAVLADILTYHVADGKVMSTDLTDKQVITTLQKGTVAISIDVSIDGETVKVNDATVIVADVAAFLASDACAEPGDGDSGAALLSVSAAMVGVGLV